MLMLKLLERGVNRSCLLLIAFLSLSAAYYLHPASQLLKRKLIVSGCFMCPGPVRAVSSCCHDGVTLSSRL